jgi:hypothetical protein
MELSKQINIRERNEYQDLSNSGGILKMISIMHRTAEGFELSARAQPFFESTSAALIVEF